MVDTFELKSCRSCKKLSSNDLKKPKCALITYQVSNVYLRSQKPLEASAPPKAFDSETQRRIFTIIAESMPETVSIKTNWKVSGSLYPTPKSIPMLRVLVVSLAFQMIAAVPVLHAQLTFGEPLILETEPSIDFVFPTLEGDKKELRRKFDRFLDKQKVEFAERICSEVHSVARICELTEAQQEKLSIAGKGVLSSAMANERLVVCRVARRLGLTYDSGAIPDERGDRDDEREILRSMSLRLTILEAGGIRSMDIVETSAWNWSIESVLSDKQVTEWRLHKEKLKDALLIGLRRSLESHRQRGGNNRRGGGRGRSQR